MSSDIFVNEDLNKPENRINLSLFGLLPSSVFRSWFLARLHLPDDAVLYPTTNIASGSGSIRPDFVIKHGCTEETLGWLEVECGSDQGQLDRFRRELNEPVLAVWGTPSPQADLSLRDIVGALEALDLTAEHHQVRYNAAHLRRLIKEALDGAQSRSYKPSPVSAAVLETPFVVALCAALKGRVSFETSGPVRRGEIRAQTMAEHGFSLRVFSRLSKVSKSLSILNQTGGTPVIWFQSREKMQKYLPHKGSAVEALVSLVDDMGGDMINLGEAGKTPVEIDVAENHVAELAAVILELAE